MGFGDIKEMQMTEGDWEEKEFGSSDGVWLNRKGPFCFSTPSLYPFFVNFHHFIASCLFSTLCHWSICWMFVFRSSLAIVSLLTHEHLSIYWAHECQDIKTRWFAKGMCLCRGGTLKCVQSECTLGLIMLIKEWWAFETDSGGWFDGCGVERANHIFWERVPFFYYMICHRHRKPH